MKAHRPQKRKDDWITPKYIFDAIGEKFSLDVAAAIDGPTHVPCWNWYHEIDNGLLRPWYGLVWMNPPFGHQSTKRTWLKRFIEHGNGIALLPDRTSAPWWQECAPEMDAICFVSPKIKFEFSDGTSAEQPAEGTCLFAKGHTARRALRHCKLGVTL